VQKVYFTLLHLFQFNFVHTVIKSYFSLVFIMLQYMIDNEYFTQIEHSSLLEVDKRNNPPSLWGNGPLQWGCRRMRPCSGSSSMCAAFWYSRCLEGLVRCLHSCLLSTDSSHPMFLNLKISSLVLQPPHSIHLPPPFWLHTPALHITSTPYIDLAPIKQFKRGRELKSPTSCGAQTAVYTSQQG